MTQSDWDNEAEVTEKIDWENAREYVQRFMRKCDDETSRERSYDLVHASFARYINFVRDLPELSDDDAKRRAHDFLALKLFAFLGSWGMLRGSSFLAYRNYTCLGDLCGIVCERHMLSWDSSIEADYAWLLDVNPFDKDFDKKKYVTDVCQLAKEIEWYFDSRGLRRVPPSFDECVAASRNDIRVEDCDGGDVDVSITLASKIILVTLGCVPAFDSYAIAGLKSQKYFVLDRQTRKKHMEKGKGVIDSRELDEKNGVLSFVYNYKDILEKVRQSGEEDRRRKNRGDEVTEYSYMKYTDMILWEHGFSVAVENEAEKPQPEDKRDSKRTKTLISKKFYPNGSFGPPII